MDGRPIVLTGFEPYGGRGVNPAFEVVRFLDGKTIRGYRIQGVTLSVSIAGLGSKIKNLINSYNPAILLSLGLWPGEPVIRLERFAVNFLDFETPDNEGQVLLESPIKEGGNVALSTTLPLETIQERLLMAGIPARISNSAGTFLCNAVFYECLSVIGEEKLNILCGFIHLPYLPQQVTDLLIQTRNERKIEIHQRADLASMDLAMMVRAVEICLDCCTEYFSESKPGGR